MRGSWKIRIIIGLLIAGYTYWQYNSSKEVNKYTGREQAMALEPQEEIAMGLQSRNQMAQQHGGLYPDESAQQTVDRVGKRLVDSSMAAGSEYVYEFHLLADDQTINAFALPGGQIFITYALFSQLETEDQLAGVLGHEIGHVLGRHSSERIADAGLWEGLAQAGSVGADMGGMIANMGQNKLLTNGRDDELESDDLGIRFMMKAGYDPYQMMQVMEILKASAGPNRVPEHKSTHPDPDNRMEKIEASIQKYKTELGL
ncbi:hypothetical protein ULMS_26010 [Patiriisocius marinistellae]|uniref:Peptidase M48 domain-containing protein n=2 Tax=Patiriisocius marinistellae TaxID=2494560 RepID=A0A5J4FYH5_9FLAO|nr:hypothetical protein ULMS_26010 [Patiriisocius marinistellae]